MSAFHRPGSCNTKQGMQFSRTDAKPASYLSEETMMQAHVAHEIIQVIVFQLLIY